MNKRIEWIDMCKGIGIVAMVCGHIGIPSVIDTYIHAWHMPIFFILSGFLFKEYEYKEFFFKKIKSLIIPYINFACILYMFSLFRNFILKDTNLIKQLIDIFTFNTIGDLPFGNSIWFLTCMFFVETIFMILKKFLNKELYMGISILVFSILGYVLSYYEVTLIWGVGSAFMAMIFYYFGYLLRKYYVYMKNIKLKLILIVALLIFSTILVSFNGYVNMRVLKYGNFLLFYINAILTSLTIIILAIYIEKRNILIIVRKILYYIGKNSLVFLGFNQLVIYLVNLVIKNIINNNAICSILTLIITLLLLGYSTKIINKRFKFLLGKF